MRIVILASSSFACPSLERLIQEPNIEVLGLITQPDRPVGRQQKLTPTPAKITASKHGLKIWQAEKLSQASDLLAELKSLKPDVLISVAYGQILKKDFLELAPHGVVNLHASLLPLYRGPAPINWMIIHGEKTVGVSTMYSDEGVDTGDILLQASIALPENDTAIDVTETLSQLGANLLIETLLSLDTLPRHPQNLSQINPNKLLAPFMDRNLGFIDFIAETMTLRSASPRQADFKVELSNNAQNIHNLIRGTQAWPGAHFKYHNKKISILESRVISQEGSKPVGELLSRISADKSDSSIIIKCYDGSELKILKVKPESKNTMPASAWLQGLTSH